MSGIRGLLKLCGKKYKENLTISFETPMSWNLNSHLTMNGYIRIKIWIHEIIRALNIA